jgi:hypothetical protein
MVATTAPPQRRTAARRWLFLVPVVIRFSSLPMPSSLLRCALLGSCLSALLLPLLPSPLRAQAAAPAPATPAAAAPVPRLLYTLSTRCSLAGGAPQPCTVEAIDEGGNTLYRHRIGQETISIRVTDNPVTMQRFDPLRRQWVSLRTAGALFSTNSICFNGRELCVVNPNYLNSVREDRQDVRLQGRDLVKVHFGADGRVDASCYDAGCQVDFR